jgi:hypothetical protein
MFASKRFFSAVTKTGAPTSLVGAHAPTWRILCCSSLSSAIQSTKIITHCRISNTLVRFPPTFQTRDLLPRCRREETEACLKSGNCQCGNVMLTSDVWIADWNKADPQFTQRLLWQYRPAYITHPSDSTVVIRTNCPCHAADVEFVDIT